MFDSVTIANALKQYLQNSRSLANSDSNMPNVNMPAAQPQPIPTAIKDNPLTSFLSQDVFGQKPNSNGIGTNSLDFLRSQITGDAAQNNNNTTAMMQIANMLKGIMS